MSKLVIVESPAKAKTIGRFLGSGYEVVASFGHVRDLPERADEIPESLRKEKWARLGVDVNKGFEPIYVVPDEKRQHVSALRSSAKKATELLLATDEDREGESISWHVLQLLKPAKSVTVRRIVFHEITEEAIRAALKHPRDLDENLVKAQETRRILDRLYGYTLSPLLWRKVAPRLSAGRVQSVAVRLAVLRERDRMAFRQAEYWDVQAELQAADGVVKVDLTHLESRRIADGKSFSLDGRLVDEKDLWLDRAAAQKLADELRIAPRWRVSSVKATEGKENQPPPFKTSTLQQEASRKLGMTAKRTMQTAQSLYEGIDLGGEERVGLITYMRTDSLALSDKAVKQARELIRSMYGDAYVPAKPNRYKTTSKGAQEAHEAIRPTDLGRLPQQMKPYLSDDQFRLYELIWKRTIACQMPPAEVMRTQVQVEAETPSGVARFAASGKRIIFPGFLRAYVEGSDDPDAELEGRERILPNVKTGDLLELLALEPREHFTQAPARYTEASLIKLLEELGIGRPSTYSSIISTVQERGYVFKRGNELIPTFTAFAVTELLEQNFRELVDTEFTANLEDQLDQIAAGKLEPQEHLEAFYFGKHGKAGLAVEVEERTATIPFPSIEIGADPGSGASIVVRVGRFGAFIQRGEGGKGNTANVPDGTPPGDMPLESALKMLEQKDAAETPIGTDPVSGRSVYLRRGRYGAYIEVASTETEQEAGEKPRRVTLPEGLDPSQLDEESWSELLSFPRMLGLHPDTGEEVSAAIGQYGPYIRCGTQTRNVADWREAARLNLEGAVAILNQPKLTGKREPIKPIKEFGELDGAAGNVRVLAGRFGPYVTDGKTNATLPKGQDPAAITPEIALQLLRTKAEAGPSKKRGRFTRAAPGKRRKSA